MKEEKKDLAQVQIKTDLNLKDTVLIVNEETKEVQRLPIAELPAGLKPDEEDITGEKGVLQFKDRAYKPAQFSGSGYKICRLAEGSVIPLSTYSHAFTVPLDPTADGSFNIAVDGESKKINYVGIPKAHQWQIRIDKAPTADGILQFILGDYVVPTLTIEAANVNTVALLVEYILANLVIEGITIATMAEQQTVLTFTADVVGEQENRNYSLNAGATGVLSTRIGQVQGVNKTATKDIADQIFIQNFKGFTKERVSENTVAFTSIKMLSTSVSSSTSTIVSVSNNIVGNSMDLYVVDPVKVFTSANTVYEIRYNLSFGGKEIVLPENCTLLFRGGTLRDTNLTGNQTKIIADAVQIFDDYVEFKGDFKIDKIYAEWFGAKSVFINSNNNDTEALNSPIYRVPASIDNLECSSNAFNSAFRLSTRSGGVVETLSRFYKITKRVFMPMKSHLNLLSDACIVAYMTGSGTRLMEQSYDTSEIRELTISEEPIYKIAANQFFHTDSMECAIEMFPTQTKITGRGTISLVKSRYTMGVLVRGTGFHFLDMSYGSPDIDIRVVGDLPNIYAPDVRDLVGNVDPTEAAPSDTYYWNQTTKTYFNYRLNVWSRLGNVGSADPKFNTHIRFDVGAGYSSGRLINPQIRIWGMFGWRGIEIWTHDGGWFNEGLWQGTISNNHGSSVSIFTAYDVVAHDMKRLMCQVDNRMQYDARIVQCIRGSLITPKTWDMAWVQVKCKYAIYLGKFSQEIEVTNYDRYKYLKDEGVRNKATGLTVNERDSNIFSSYALRNILKFKSPLSKNGSGLSTSFFVPLVAPLLDLETLVDLRSTNLGTGVNFPKLFFDETPSYMNIIDVDNSKYGIFFNLFGQGGFLSEMHGTLHKGTLVIEYSWNNFDLKESSGSESSAGMQDVYLSVRGTGDIWWIDSNNEKISDQISAGINTISIPKRISGFNDENGWVNTTQKLYIPLQPRHWRRRANFIAIYANKTSNIAKLNIHNIEFLVDSFTQISESENINFGTTANRPDAAPKGHIYEDSTLGATFINKGTSSVQNWVELPDEKTGVWTIATGADITAATANYSKIGKQVNLAGQLTFASGYAVNTNVPVILPFAPNYGGAYVIGDLTFTLANNSTTAQVKSVTTGTNKPFQLNFKTI